MKNSSIRFIGTGPGPQTQDGCSVELYRRLRAGNEPDIIAYVVANHGSILELGAGAGRVTHPLIARGYQLTVVDNSAEMLAHIRRAETVLANIETLDLGHQFDAVLLGSHLSTFQMLRPAQRCWPHASDTSDLKAPCSLNATIQSGSRERVQDRSVPPRTCFSR